SGERGFFIRIMIAKHRVVLAFDVQVRVIARPQQRMNDFRPVGLAESGKPMLRHSRMTDPVHLQQLPVDVSVLGVYVKNPRAELAEVRPKDFSRTRDRKSTRLNSSHVAISYAVFCLKKKTRGSRRDT